MNINKIIVGERVRRDMGDLTSLASSMARGLLHPVVVRPDGTLIAGHRRLEAARLLGWKNIPATVIEVDDLLSAERDENMERKDFTPSEAVAIGRLIEEQHKVKIAAAIPERNRGIARSRGAKKRGESTSPINNPVGDTRDVVGRAVGMSGSKYAKAKAVVSAAEADPQNFGDLPERMDETGNVNGAHEEMKRRKSGNGARHPVHRKTRYPQHAKTVEKSISSLEGICSALGEVDLEQLEPGAAAPWAKQLRECAATISRIAKSMEKLHV